MNTATLDPEIAAFMGIAAEPTNQPTTTQTADPLAFLDGIGAEPVTKSGKVYPVLPDNDGTAAQLAKRSIELSDAKEQLETNNKLLGELVTPYFFRHWHGKPEFESSIRVQCDIGSVLVTCMKKVSKMKDTKTLDPVRHILGAKEKDLFYHTFDLKVDGDEIPPANVGGLVTEMKALFAKHGATKALKVERQYKPYPAFFTQRMIAFTPEQNMEINRNMRMTTAVKVKGVS